MQPQICQDRGLINVGGDLFGATLGGDVLGASQLGSPGIAGKRDQILGDDWYGSARTLGPWRVGGRVDNNLTDDPPAGVVGITACDQESCQRVGDALGSGLKRVSVQMSQRGANLPAILHGPRQFLRGPPRPVVRVIDLSTLPGQCRCTVKP